MYFSIILNCFKGILVLLTTKTSTLCNVQKDFLHEDKGRRISRTTDRNVNKRGTGGTTKRGLHVGE
jgi:hypothetical protein